MKLSKWHVGSLMMMAAGLVVLATTTLAVRAADHADSPDTTEGNLDINDIFVFNQGPDVVFIMTVAPLLAPGEATANAALNPGGLYEFKLDVERDGVEDAVIQVAALGSGPEQSVSFRGPVPAEMTGTSSRLVAAQDLRLPFNTAGSMAGMRAWAGPSDDPFYVDLFGDRSLISVLNAAFGAALGQQVGDAGQQSLAFSDPAQDDLAGLNTLSIVVQVPKDAVASALGISTDDTFFVWGATSER